MSESNSRTSWAAVAMVSAMVLGSTLAWMIVDELVDRRRTEAQELLIDSLELAVRRDASSAAELDAERKDLTDRTLERRDRNQLLGLVLAASTILLVVASKRYRALAGGPIQSREDLIAIRSRSAGTSSVAVFSAPSEGTDQPTGELDFAFVDHLLEREGRDPEATIPILQAIQKHYRYLPDEALRRVCERSEITPSMIAGSATFYAQFRSTPVGRHVVRICHGTACHVAGVGQISDELRRRLSMHEGQDTDSEMRFTLDPVACLGCCSLAPVMMVGEETAGHLTPTTAWEALSSLERSP